jgi:hypothetical protein
MLRPTLRAGGAPVPGAVEFTVEPQAEPPLLERRALPRRLYERHERRTLVVFDEFQDVLATESQADAVIRSEIQHHGDAASYVFSGSHLGMMRELFADRRRAFYGQAAPIELPPLLPDDVAEYVADRFRRTGRFGRPRARRAARCERRASPTDDAAGGMRCGIARRRARKPTRRAGLRPRMPSRAKSTTRCGRSRARSGRASDVCSQPSRRTRKRCMRRNGVTAARAVEPFVQRRTRSRTAVTSSRTHGLRPATASPIRCSRAGCERADRRPERRQSARHRPERLSPHGARQCGTLPPPRWRRTRVTSR